MNSSALGAGGTLYIAISHHGYGHLAQCALVLNRLSERLPNLAITVHSGLPEQLLRTRIAAEFYLWPEEVDVGVAMHDALRVDLESSVAQINSFHSDWEERVVHLATRLKSLAPDLVLSNVAYWPLAAAARVGLPAIAFCSLNWAAIYRALLAERLPTELLTTVTAAYRSANSFIAPEPSMSMEELDNVICIEPLAPHIDASRQRLREQLQLIADERLVMVALGGIPTVLELESTNAPRLIHWLVPQEWDLQHPNFSTIESAGLAVAELMGAVDLVITKPGYGVFVEATVARVPVVYLPRDDWPESGALVSWLQRYNRAAAYSWRSTWPHDIAALMEDLLSRPAPALPARGGVEQTVTQLLKFFDSGSN